MSSKTIYRFHYVYRITNTVERKYYYGVHSCNDLSTEAIGVKYLSSTTDKDFIKDQKQNPSHYQYKIIRFFKTREDAVAFEKFLHEKFDVKTHPKFYNRSNQTSTGFDTTGVPHSEETKRKLSEANKGKTVSEETKRKLSEANKGKTVSEEARRKIGEANKGKTHSEETKRKLSEANKDKTVSEETKRKLSEVHKGKPKSEEHRRKIGDASKGRTHSEEHRRKIGDASKGRTHSEEARRKMSEANKGKPKSEEHRRKIGDASKGEKHPMYGKKLSAETRAKISAAQKKIHERKRKEREALEPVFCLL